MEVILIAAITLDGFIAHATNESSLAWTSKEDTQWFIKKTKEIGTLIMGRTTFDTIGKPLKDRQIIVLSSGGQPITHDKLGEKNTVLPTNASPQEVIGALQSKSIPAVAVCGGASVYTRFLKDGLVTRLFLTVEPVLFGGGVPLLSEVADIRLQQVSEFPLSTTAFVREYSVISANPIA